MNRTDLVPLGYDDIPATVSRTDLIPTRTTEMNRDIIEYQPQQSDTGFYQLVESKPWLALMPSKIIAPKTVEEQVAELDEPPTDVQVREIGGKPVPYLGIDYIEPELYKIFGTRNILILTLPGYPSERDGGKTQRGDPKIAIMIHILLCVRYADGEVQHLEGWGENDYQSSNTQVSKANAIRAALSYAVTDAAKRLGRHFGAGLKDMIADGLMDRIEAASARDTITKLADGTRVWWDSTIEAEVHVTDNVLDDICSYIVKKPFSEVEGKEAVTVAKYIETLPTLEQLQTELDALQAVDSSIPDDISYHELMQRKRQMAEARRKQPAGRR